ncbi:hypothetical protein HanXRQr2_Chr16g0749411 [Helianthus annuus]|uniref:Uncharacterized protein n=1 Tax=Helianthus annuus TaxID=4232 RepID=A0A9K3GXV9_HELAN|nr:hypothetical protein HanXRQr2_Chr16g0749411 [Helianthus annuus]KAJ0821291.1 hypothetical protein HanPSC8_Chr16g0718331 [Helianthus annuus]
MSNFWSSIGVQDGGWDLKFGDGDSGFVTYVVIKDAFFTTKLQHSIQFKIIIIGNVLKTGF